LLVFFIAGFGPACRKRGTFALLFSSGAILLWAFGIPPFSLASHLPFFNRLRPHYGIVTIAFVAPILIGFGYQRLARWPQHLRGSTVAAGSVWVLAAGIAVLTLKSGGVAPGRAGMYVATRSILTLLWICIGLLVLFILRARSDKREYRARLFCVTLAGIALSAVGLFPWGSQQGIVAARWSSAASFFLVAGLAVLPSINSKLLPALAALTVIVSGLAIEVTPNHLPRRHDLMAHGAYIDYLKRHQRPEYRSYGVDGFLFPNFSAVNGVTSVNVITGMLTGQIEQFFSSYLDLDQGPEQVMGKGTSGITSVFGTSCPRLRMSARRRLL
jgi:hypothetical protein